MPTRNALSRFILPVIVLALSPSVWAVNPSFLTTGLARNVRAEGLAELAGTISLTVNNSGATVAGGSSIGITYSAPVSATASDDGSNKALSCTLGGVTGACPSDITATRAGNSIFIGFNSTRSLSVGDGVALNQVRLNITAVPAGTQQVTAQISGGGNFSVSQSTITVVSSIQTSLNTSASSVTPAASGAFACTTPGTTAMAFSVSVTENFAGAFSTVAQEGGAGVATATSGGNLEVVLTNVPAGVTITPVSTTGTTSALTLGALPAASTSTGGTLTFSFPFSAVSTGSVGTAVVNFNAGFTSPIPLSALSASAVTARARLGPISSAAVSPPNIVSFVDNTAATGSVFRIVPCNLSITGTVNPVKFQTAAGSGPVAVVGAELYEGQANVAAYATTISTSSGGNWLSIAPSSGTTPTDFTVTYDATNLTPGTYTGQIIFSAVGANPTTLTAQFTIVSPNPVISLNQTAFTFNALTGASSPPTQSTALNNSGSGTLNWTATPATTSGGTWLSVSPTSGSGGAILIISVNSTGLAAGQYTGTILVAATGATNTQTISVTLTVASSPMIALSPTSLSFASAVGANPGTQSIQVSNSGGGTLGVTVAASTLSGGSWLSVTPTTGTAPLTLTVTAAASGLAAGNYQGTITVTTTAASGATNSPQTVNVTLGVGTPLINAGGVVNGASYAANASVTPGSIGTVFGQRLSANTATAQTLPLQTTLGGTQVFLNGTTGTGIACPLFYVSPTQINFQMPVESTASTATITVVSGGIAGPPITVPTGSIYPAIFTTNGGGTGPAAALNANFSANGSTNPAAAGSGVSLFVTGLGATNPAVATGQAGASAAPLNQTVAAVTVTINGVSVTPSFSGLAPGFVGLYQLNVTIPQGTASGQANVQVLANGVTSNTAQISVK